MRFVFVGNNELEYQLQPCVFVFQISPLLCKLLFISIFAIVITIFTLSLFPLATILGDAFVVNYCNYSMCLSSASKISVNELYAYEFRNVFVDSNIKF